MPPRGFPPMNGPMQGFPSPFRSMPRTPMIPQGRMFQAPMQAMGRPSLFGGAPPSIGSTGSRAGGGLISRLFQRAGTGQAGNVANAAAGFQRATGGGGSLLGNLGNIANPGKIGSFLNNTQNVIRTAQQIGPMVQQYGPLVKNLPAMWRMYKGLKSVGSDDDSDENVDTENQEVEVESESNNKSENNQSKKGNTSKKTSSKNSKMTKKTDDIDLEIESESTETNKKGQSVPKLYI
ncbi:MULTISPECIES: YqfQ family protein [Heyndrickxia]|uniref:YqfQ family protein n=1 Tax=Heyndrickxia TaxID=2837504 RepID=UPI001B272A12|nr:YqfQ family protein [Heyndrickxia oleronia]GIN38523.1 hypothetical protein J19TS1_14720 [Heyndrickxia oleronia]